MDTVAQDKVRGASMRLGAVIVLPILLVAALAAGLTAFLNYGKFAATLAEVENARFALVARGVKTAIEANLNLGLTLSGLSTAPSILDQEREVVAEVRTVLVYGADGLVLFSAGAPAGLRRVPGEWLNGSEWAADAEDARVVGTPLFDAFGSMLGGVAVLYPREPRERALSEMATRLTVAGLVAAAVTGLAALLYMPLLNRRLRGLSAEPEGLAPDLEAELKIAARAREPA